MLTWIFEKHATWAICNVEMMLAISFFLTNVEMKQFGMGMFASFKEIILHLVCLFIELVILPPLCEVVSSSHVLHHA
jgi:hypothetical protein